MLWKLSTEGFALCETQAEHEKQALPSAMCNLVGQEDWHTEFWAVLVLQVEIPARVWSREKEEGLDWVFR